MGLKEPSQPIHISYPQQICLNPGEKSGQYQSFLQVANALATEMKFFTDSYNQGFSSVEGQMYQNLDFTPGASVWDMITGVQGENIPADQACPDQNAPFQVDPSFQAAIQNFNWADINSAIKDKCGDESYDAIMNGTGSVKLSDLSDEQAFDLMCSMLDSKEKVFGAYESIFGKAEDLGNNADVIGNINKFLANNNTIDPHNMGLISLFFSLEGHFMDALSQFSSNSAFMGKVSNYISTLSGTQQDAANVLQNEWTTDMRRWDQVNGVSVNCNLGAFQTQLATLTLNSDPDIDADLKAQVIQAYEDSNGDSTLFSTKLASITSTVNGQTTTLTNDNISDIQTAFSSAKKTFLDDLHAQLLKITGLSTAQIDKVVQAYEDSNGDPNSFSGALNSINPPLTNALIAAVQAALVSAENDFKTLDPTFDPTKGDNWYDYFHYEMTTFDNKDAVRSLTSNMYNNYVDNKYKTDEADYQTKKDDRIDDEIALMKLEAKHRAEAKAAMNALLKRKPSSVATKSVKSPASKSAVSTAKRAPAVAPRASQPVVSAPAMRQAQSAAIAAGFAARNASAAAIAAGASSKRSSSAISSSFSANSQPKKNQKDEKKVI